MPREERGRLALPPRLGQDVEGDVVQGAVGHDRQAAVAELAGHRSEEHPAERLPQPRAPAVALVSGRCAQGLMEGAGGALDLRASGEDEGAEPGGVDRPEVAALGPSEYSSRSVPESSCFWISGVLAAVGCVSSA